MARQMAYRQYAKGLALVRGEHAEIRVETIEEITARCKEGKAPGGVVIVAREGTNAAVAKDVITQCVGSFGEASAAVDTLEKIAEGDLEKIAHIKLKCDLWMLGVSVDWSPSTKDWQRVINIVIPTIDRSSGTNDGINVLLPWPLKASSGHLQSLLAAMSFELESKSVVFENIAFTIVALNASQRNDLIASISSRTLRAMAAAVAKSDASALMHKHIKVIRSTLQEALANKSQVEDALLHLKMEKLYKVVQETTCVKGENRITVCIAAAHIATRLLQLLGGDAPVKDIDEPVEGNVESVDKLMTPNDVSMMVQKGMLANEFSDCFNRLLMVSKLCSTEKTTPSIADIVIVLVALTVILEAILKVETEQEEELNVVLPDGLPSVNEIQSQLGSQHIHSDMKEGDWICAQCGDLQFARNVRCRKCNAPKPNYNDYTNRTSKSSDRDRSQWTTYKQDWECSKCGDYQFARNTSCRRCGHPREVASMGEQSPTYNKYGQQRDQHSGSQAYMAGDWICSQCNDLQFARNMQCRRCGAPKPMGTSPGIPRQDRRVQGYRSREYQGHNSYNNHKNHRGTRLGDWICPECGDNVFGRNASCRRCGCPRPRHDDDEGELSKSPYGQGASFPGPGSPGSYGLPRGFDSKYNKKYSKYDSYPSRAYQDNAYEDNGSHMHTYTQGGFNNRKNFKAGDWICSQCNDLQFARNMQCRRCGNPRP